MGESEVCVAHCSWKASRAISVFSLYPFFPPPYPSIPDFRLCASTLLDSKFNAHLGHPKNITMLFVALHDENLYVWEMALATIGRPGDLNPTLVIPSLLKALIQILMQLEYSGIGRNKELLPPHISGA